MTTVLVVLRSTLYNLFYVLWTVLLGVLYLPLLAVPGRLPEPPVRLWAAGLLVGARVLAGIKWRVEGLEHLPKGPCLIVSKHQSAWETLFFPMQVPHVVYVLKQELLRIPLVGWYMAKAGSIAIDRKAGAGALKKMVREAEAAFKDGAAVVLFPEGTRVAVGAKRPYQPGVAALYTHFGDKVPVIPVALNSGLSWGRQAFFKRPGTVVVRFLPPIPSGLDKRAFVTTLSERIEAETEVLCKLCSSCG